MVSATLIALVIVQALLAVAAWGILAILSDIRRAIIAEQPKGMFEPQERIGPAAGIRARMMGLAPAPSVFSADMPSAEPGDHDDFSIEGLEDAHHPVILAPQSRLASHPPDDGAEREP